MNLKEISAAMDARGEAHVYVHAAGVDRAGVDRAYRALRFALTPMFSNDDTKRIWKLAVRSVTWLSDLASDKPVDVSETLADILELQHVAKEWKRRSDSVRADNKFADLALDLAEENRKAFAKYREGNEATGSVRVPDLDSWKFKKHGSHGDLVEWSWQVRPAQDAKEQGTLFLITIGDEAEVDGMPTGKFVVLFTYAGGLNKPSYSKVLNKLGNPETPKKAATDPKLYSFDDEDAAHAAVVKFVKNYPSSFVTAGIGDIFRGVKEFINPQGVKDLAAHDVLDQLASTGSALVSLKDAQLVKLVIEKLKKRNIPYKTMTRNNKVAILLSNGPKKFQDHPSIFDSAHD